MLQTWVPKEFFLSEFLTKIKQKTFDMQFFAFYIILWEFLGVTFGENRSSALGMGPYFNSLQTPLKNP